MPDDATESVANTDLGCNHLHALVTTFMFSCSGTQIYNPEVIYEVSGVP